MNHFPSRSMIAVNSLWNVCLDMHLSYREHVLRTSGEMKDNDGPAPSNGQESRDLLDPVLVA